MTKRRRAPGEKCPIVKLSAVPLGVGIQYFGRINFRIRGDRKELNLRMLFWSETDLCLAQSSCDQRANVHAGRICEGNDNHPAGEAFEVEAGAVLIHQSKIFNRSSRYTSLGTSRLDLSGQAVARYHCECDRQ